MPDLSQGGTAVRNIRLCEEEDSTGVFSRPDDGTSVKRRRGSCERSVHDPMIPVKTMSRMPTVKPALIRVIDRISGIPPP